jgi:hypothetical protein
MNLSSNSPERKSSFNAAISHFQVAVSKISQPFLLLTDLRDQIACAASKPRGHDLDTEGNNVPMCCLNGLFTVGKEGKKVRWAATFIFDVFGFFFLCISDKTFLFFFPEMPPNT